MLLLRSVTRFFTTSGDDTPIPTVNNTKFLQVNSYLGGRTGQPHKHKDVSTAHGTENRSLKKKNLCLFML